MIQSIFKFEPRPDYDPQNFLISPANQEAYNAITGEWKSYALIIHGPRASGKTYLATIAKDQGINVIDEISSKTDERKLLHKLNTIKEKGERVLITSDKPVELLDFALPDLTSRLAAINSIAISPPDSELFYLLFARYFAARQLKVGDDVISYLASRIERSFAAAWEIVEKLDKLSLEQKRNITIPLVKSILAEKDA